MGMSFSGLMMMVMGVVLGGNNELLNHVQTEAYWKAQGVTVAAEAMLEKLQPGQPGEITALLKDLGSAEFKTRQDAHEKIVAMGPDVIPQVKPLMESPDPEVAERARQIIEQLSGRQKTFRASRLMAVRTLGELKSKEALPALRQMLTSKEPFVAEYAARAIALINGAAIEPRKFDRKALQADLMLLPRDCGLVGQLSFAGSDVVLSKMFEGTEEVPGPMGKEQLIARLESAMVSFADMAGNVRVDGLTLGVAHDVGPNSGSVVLVVRGLWDLEAFKQAFAQVKPQQMQAIDGVALFRPDRNVNFLLAADDRIVMVSGPSGTVSAAVDEVMKGLKSGKGGLADNQEMMKLISSADTGHALWAVAKMSDAYRQLHPMFAPFDTASLVGRQKGETLTLELTAQGQDPEQVKQGVAAFQTDLEKLRREVQHEVARHPGAKVVAEFLETVQAEASGAKATVKALVKSVFLMVGMWLSHA